MAEPVRLPNLPYDADAGLATRARIGLVTLSGDVTIEADLTHVFGHVPGIAFYGSRIEMDSDVTPETLTAMEARIAGSTALMVPDEPFQAVGFGCTSASALLGDDRVAAQVHAQKPEAKVTNPVAAMTAAMQALGARRISVLTPYTAKVNAGIEVAMAKAGFEIAAFGSFDEPHDPTVGRMTPASIAAASRQVAAAAPTEALFISCTNLRACALVPELEAELGIPVTTSNHAIAWHLMRLSGIEDRLPFLGRLYENP
ncbi:MAG: Asp/Glu racemase [Pseudomonadota bacterium]